MSSEVIKISYAKIYDVMYKYRDLIQALAVPAYNYILGLFQTLCW